MRKLLLLLLCAAELLLFAGQRGPRKNYREVEELLVVQTMGLDRTGGGVTLSLAAAADSERGVTRLRADGVSISAAMDRIRGYSYEEDLFCPHIARLLLGEKAAEQGIESTLAYICRSPHLRLDLPLFIVRGDTAEKAVLEVGGDKGICDVMRGVEQEARRTGTCGLTTACDVLRDTARCGSALVCALDLGQASEQPESETDKQSEGEATAQSEGEATTPAEGQATAQAEGETGKQAEGQAPAQALSAAPLGYAILREGRLCRYLTREQGIAVSFLKNEVGPAAVELRDRYGNPAVLEITGGGSRIKPLWEGGALRGLAVQCDAQAGILELGGRRALSGTADEDYLTARLEAELSRYLSETLQASKDLKSDFLCLAELVERDDPAAYRALGQEFVDLLPELELEITVSARLSEMNDMK